MSTVGEALDAAEKALADAGIPTARHDAEWIAARALNRRRGELVAHADDDFPAEIAEQFRQLISRRARREPLAYVTGITNFRGLELEVGAGCLVPRPETEVTAERAILRARERGPKPTVIDVGAGCGAIALSIAAEVPNARIFATEPMGAARGWALRNLARTGLRCTLLPGSLMTPLHPALGGGVDVLVSNPPYVPAQEWETLEPEVRKFEPREAVVGGDSGFELLELIAELTRAWLAPGGWIVLECAPSQAIDLMGKLDDLQYDEIVITRDLAGRERVVEGRWGR